MSSKLGCAKLFDARLNIDDTPMPRSALAEAMRVAEVIVPTVTDKIDAELIGVAGQQMRLIANFGNGVDNIDVPAALGRGMIVTNTPGVLTEDTADMTMALILTVARRLVEGAKVIPAGEWTGWAPTWMLGRRISGKRLEIVGMGRIGQALAHRAKAFGLQIHYHNRRPVAAPVEEALEATYWECWIKCSSAWTSFRSIARILPRPIICCRRAAKISPPACHSRQYRAGRNHRRDRADTHA